MSRNLRSSHNSPKPKPVSRADELDDLLAAPSLKPNLRFLGLRDDITNITAAPGDINQYGFLGPSVDDLRSVGAGNPAPFDLAARSIPTASPAVIAEGLISDVNAQTGESPLSAGPILIPSPAVINDAPQADANAQTEERRPPSPRPVLITSPAVTPSPAVIKRQTHPLPSLPSPAVIAGDDLLASPAIINDAPQADANAQTEERRPPSPRPVLITSPAVTPSPAVIKRQTHPLPSLPSPAVTAGDDLLASPAVKSTRLIHHCKKVQDGHSHIEQAVYQILWNNGMPQKDGTRLCQLGLPRIAREACVHERNVGTIIRRLIQKEAVKIAQKEISDLRTARTYRVYGYREILDRRKAVGLEWVVRRRGVEFVDFQTGQSLFHDADLSPQAISTGDAVTPPVTDDVTAPESPGVTAPESPAVTPGPLGITSGIRQETSASFSDILITALQKYGAVDDEVVAHLITACRQNAPDCTIDEIVAFVEQKGAMILQDRSGTIKRPIGFLLATVPKCFMGESFRLYRQAKFREEQKERSRREDAALELKKWRDEQHALLCNPDVAEEDKRLLKRVLGID
jgi:hypothetical protein